MTYNVFGGTLNLAQSISDCNLGCFYSSNDDVDVVTVVAVLRRVRHQLAAPAAAKARAVIVTALLIVTRTECFSCD